jgi:hypothetical protein
MTVRSHLDAIGEPSGEVLHEVVSSLCIPVADVPAGDKFRFGVYGRPSPNIAPALTLFFRRNIHFFCAYKTPNLIALDALTGEISESLILEVRAGLPGVNEEFDDAVNGDTRQPGSRADAISFDQTAKDLSPFFGVQFVHEINMLARASIVNKKIRFILPPIGGRIFSSVCLASRGQEVSAKTFKPPGPVFLFARYRVSSSTALGFAAMRRTIPSVYRKSTKLALNFCSVLPIAHS